jgi:hypothetical protein
MGEREALREKRSIMFFGMGRMYAPPLYGCLFFFTPSAMDGSAGF